MAERIVSAGVFTKEIDQSFLPAAVGQIGAAIVGPTVKGPALVPTKISSFSEFQQIFGSYTDESYVPYAVEEYLRNADAITVTRLLYEDGYKLKNGALAVIATSGSGAAQVKIVTHILHPTLPVKHVSNTTDVFESSLINNYQSGSFEIKVSGSFASNVYSAGEIPGWDGIGTFLKGNGASISASIDSNSNSYITKIFGKSPKSLDYPVYVQYENANATASFANMGNVSIELAKITDYDFSAASAAYSSASTPWITSQKIGGLAKNLIKFHTLSHGTAVNSDVKIGIRDIRTNTEVSDPEGYPLFTVEVRRVNTTNIANTPYSSNDTDQIPDIVETYRDVNLNPNSPNYIARKIGNRYQSITTDGAIKINGEYPNMSKYIRVEVANIVQNGAAGTLVPFGFRSVYSPIPMASSSINLKAVSYKTSQTDTAGIYSPSNYLGFDFSNLNNLNYLAPIPKTGNVTGSNADFYLGDVTQDAAAGYPTLTTAYSGSIETALTAGTIANVALSTRKFIVPMQGGFDGARPHLPKLSGEDITQYNTFGFDCSGTGTAGTVAYNKAFSLLSNTDFYDLNMLIIPGILNSLHGAVATNARNLCVARQDTFFVMDTHAIDASISSVVADNSTIDNNYTATYWPWVRILNPAKNVPVWVPPSVVVPGALTFNDSVAAPWYAPAGLNRGGLVSVLEAYSPLSQAERNSLYEGRVNPIATFPNDGVVVWGQKTLQARPSALDRVNVRRLLITVKKFIASSTRYLVFEQNTSATRDRFLSIVNPYLESVRRNQGLYAFKVIMDESNNTPDVIDQNILYGQLFLQPTRTAEFIILDFNIQPTGAAFPE